mmetsp:Transcript_26089/g.58961  ORF Transcript_26089/g.58961 Transcript_26089/m.58961 type:complete len:227 (-) Transcript_26089:1668-2348(-)
MTWSWRRRKHQQPSADNPQLVHRQPTKKHLHKCTTCHSLHCPTARQRGPTRITYYRFRNKLPGRRAPAKAQLGRYGLSAVSPYRLPKSGAHLHSHLGPPSPRSSVRPQLQLWSGPVDMHHQLPDINCGTHGLGLPNFRQCRRLQLATFPCRFSPTAITQRDDAICIKCAPPYRDGHIHCGATIEGRWPRLCYCAEGSHCILYQDLSHSVFPCFQTAKGNLIQSQLG